MRVERAPTPLPQLNEALVELVTRASEILDENFIGAYLQGSFAIGDFDDQSDVDFLIVDITEREPNRLVEKLRISPAS